MAATVIVPRHPFDTKIGDIVIDASITETHVLENEITDHPVEQGANISDHSRPLPDSFTMECVVSNTPILPAAALGQLGQEVLHHERDVLPSVAQGWQ